jgi:hypothetical protein
MWMGLFVIMTSVILIPISTFLLVTEATPLQISLLKVIATVVFTLVLIGLVLDILRFSII